MILQLCVGVLFMRAGQRNCKQHNLTATFRNCTQHPFVLSRLSARIVEKMKKCSKEASLISVGAKAFASAHETCRETFLEREQFFFPLGLNGLGDLLRYSQMHELLKTVTFS